MASISSSGGSDHQKESKSNKQKHDNHDDDDDDDMRMRINIVPSCLCLPEHPIHNKWMNGWIWFFFVCQLNLGQRKEKKNSICCCHQRI
mgnify:CR=1 FL=1